MESKRAKQASLAVGKEEKRRGKHGKQIELGLEPSVVGGLAISGPELKVDQTHRAAG